MIKDRKSHKTQTLIMNADKRLKAVWKKHGAKVHPKPTVAQIETGLSAILKTWKSEIYWKQIFHLWKYIALSIPVPLLRWCLFIKSAYKFSFVFEELVNSYNVICILLVVFI